MQYSIAGCLLRNSGAYALAEALASNKTLETVELPGKIAWICSMPSSSTDETSLTCSMHSSATKLGQMALSSVNKMQEIRLGCKEPRLFYIA